MSHDEMYDKRSTEQIEKVSRTNAVFSCAIERASPVRLSLARPYVPVDAKLRAFTRSCNDARTRIFSPCANAAPARVASCVAGSHHAPATPTRRRHCQRDASCRKRRAPSRNRPLWHADAARRGKLALAQASHLVLRKHSQGDASRNRP